MNRKASTSFFNFRLFLEALKRLRVIGLGSAILALTASALVPAVTWIEQGSYTRADIYEMDTELLCVPAGAMVILAPLFFFVLFSFLQKRKESDFFHAIPYTRTCVYVSFVTAALVFIWVIQLACGVTAGVLWGMIPRVSADVGSMFAYVGLSMLAAAMLSAFMMLSLTLSGTGGSCFLLFLLFAGFVRVVCAIFLGCMDTIYFIGVNTMWNSSFLSPLWMLPVSVIYYWGGISDIVLPMFTLPNILYSLIVTVGLFTLAGLFYNRRKSEMAGNPAPGVKTQALFRILFTSLGVLLIPLLAITGFADAALMLVLIVGVLLVYFLYELITTKRPKNLLKIMPGLGIVAGVCVTFFLTYGLYYNVVTSESITPDDVKWVSVESGGFSRHSYQDRLSENLHTNDPELVKTITDRLAVSQQYQRDGVPDNGYEADYFDRMQVTIRLKNGRTLHRYISMGDAAREVVRTRYADLEDMKNIMLLLPQESEIRNGSVRYMTDDRYEMYAPMDENSDYLISTFLEEYETLTEEQKLLVMAPTLMDYKAVAELYKELGLYQEYDKTYDAAMHKGMFLYLTGYVNGRSFNSTYIITDDMPKTKQAIAAVIALYYAEQCNYYLSDSGLHGSPQKVLATFRTDAAYSEFAKFYPTLKGHVMLTGFSLENMNEAPYQTFILNAEDYDRFAELIAQNSAVTDTTTVENFVLDENTYYLSLYTDYDSGKYARLDLTVRGIFKFTPEEIEELKEILHIEK